MTIPVTYADVADTLSPDVREAIEVALPCPDVPGGVHIWDHWPEWWRCVYCGAVARTDPRPAEARAFDRDIVIVPARLEDFL